MAGRFTRRGAVITAGGSGIDAATADGSVQEGAAVVIADLSGKRAAAQPPGRMGGPEDIAHTVLCRSLTRRRFWPVKRSGLMAA